MQQHAIKSQQLYFKVPHSWWYPNNEKYHMVGHVHILPKVALVIWWVQLIYFQVKTLSQDY